MTADEIRKNFDVYHSAKDLQVLQTEIMVEIAAQLAEINEKLIDLVAIVAEKGEPSESVATCADGNGATTEPVDARPRARSHRGAE
jgi:hypothetical protein